MVFIKKCRIKGHIYLYVVSNYREKGRIRQKVHGYIGKEKDLPNLLLNSIKMKVLLEAKIENLLYGSIASLYKLSEDLNLKEIFSKHFKKEWGVEASLACIAMILNYAIERKSKRKLQEWYDQTYLKHLLNIKTEKMNEDLFYRTLDFFTEKNIEIIHSEIYKTAKERFNLSDEILFYDLTAVTFEGKNCNLAKKGYNSERLYKLQVNLGLSATRDKFPVSHKVFEGNTKDVQTIEKIIAILERFIPLNKAIFIFDRGMDAESNYLLIESKNSKYIAGFSKKKKLKDIILRLNESDFSKIDENTSFVERKIENRRIIAYYNKELQEEQREIRKKKLQKIIAKLEKLKKNVKKYSKERLYEKIGEITSKYRSCFDIKVTETLEFSLKENKIKELESLEGRYGIITNTDIQAEEILKHYREKNFIEMSFKDLKLFVDIRPVRHWKANRVLAHVFLAVIAFGLRSLLELKLKRKNINLSAQEAINRLNKVRALVAKGKLLKLTGEDEETIKIATTITN